MRPSFLALVFVFATTGSTVAQAPAPSTAPVPALFGVRVGQHVADLRATYGDPIAVLSEGPTQIYRYLALNGGIFLDIMSVRNLVRSVTVVSRFPKIPFTDPRGAAFGITSAQLRTLFGAPDRITTNADDGSVDLWYRDAPNVWIYEFYSDKLGFIQLLAPAGAISAMQPGPPVTVNDGTSLARAAWIRPANILLAPEWVYVYLTNRSCGGNGHWEQQSTKILSGEKGDDPLAYMAIGAKCSTGDLAATFYFDMRGAVQSNTVDVGGTVYYDTGAMSNMPSPTPSASSP